MHCTSEQLAATRPPHAGGRRHPRPADAAGELGAVRVMAGTADGDFDSDGAVGILDLLALLANWGPCP